MRGALKAVAAAAAAGRRRAREGGPSFERPVGGVEVEPSVGCVGQRDNSWGALRPAQTHATGRKCLPVITRSEGTSF